MREALLTVRVKDFGYCWCRIVINLCVYEKGEIEFVYVKYYFKEKRKETKTFNTYDEVREYWKNEYNKAQNKEETIETKIKPITGKVEELK